MTNLKGRVVVAVLVTVSTATASEEKAHTHMTSAAMSALVLSEVAELHSAAITNKGAKSNKLQLRLSQATAAAVGAATSNIQKAALPIAFLIAKKLHQATTAQLNFADKLIRAQTKLANLTGNQFGTANCDDLKVPSIISDNTDADAITSGSGNIYLTSGPKTYGPATHTTFNTKRQHSIDWAKQDNFDQLTIYELKLKEKGGAAEAPLMGKAQSDSGNKCKSGTVSEDGGNNNNNLCIVSGAVTKTQALNLKKATKNFNTEGRATFNTGKFEHYAEHAAKATHDIMGEIQAAKTNFDPDDLASYTADEDFIAAVGLVFLGLDRQAATANNGKAVQDTIKSHYGTGKDITTKFWDKLKEIKKPSKLLGTDQMGDISSVTDLGTA
uniref:Variant surface glycoprotein 1499 n=1 Tax=Trypanosoma brucei TaxID=5691 RepID=M4T0B1_9TRYP|nr:variant surface glycoprotein 1499 [Trypanosoma brucei]